MPKPRSKRVVSSIEGNAVAPAKSSEVEQRLDVLKAPIRPVSAHAQVPMLANSQDTPPSAQGWIFEIKFDGVRVLAQRKDDNVELYGRNGTIVTARYPEVCGALRELSIANFIIDGEIIACDKNGRPSFQRLQARMHLTNRHEIERLAATAPVDAIFFDCIALQERDLRELPLIERKECLQLFVPAQGRIRYSEHFVAQGADVLEAATQLGLEGIVAKRAGSRYVSGRSSNWLKIKCYKSEDFVIGGYTDPQGGRARFGALHLGLYRDDKLIYVSKVGGGFDTKMLDVIWRKMQPLARATTPFVERSPTGRGHHWIEPRLVCEVRFSDWTADGGIRHPVFLGLREDKDPKECCEPLRNSDAPL